MSSRDRLVIKFGTGVLSKPGGSALAPVRFREICAEVAALVHEGISCVIVSSAAIAAGVSVLGRKSRPEALADKQACAATGQPELMRLYANSFRPHRLKVAQLLLTHSDIDSRVRRANAGNTLERLLAAGDIVPIINENDSVAVEEVRFGDNDRLSAEVALLVRASRLLLCTSSDGLTDAGGHRVPVVRDLQKAHALVRPEKGAFSVGGMKTKLEAVGVVLDHGIPATILDGRQPSLLAIAAHGGDAGTRFLVEKKPVRR